MSIHTNLDSISELKEKASKIVEGVSDHPEGRYHLREQFYAKYGDGHFSKEGLGNSELAFLRWEIERGVLNPLDDSTQVGSAWWRNVNSSFIYHSTLADLIHQSGQTFPSLPSTVQLWLDYIHAPSETTWYRAHNASILRGYLDHYAEIYKENKYEWYFVNIVLYRLLFAQAMVEGVEFGRLGKLLADPRGPAVGIITDIGTFYPRHYPLSRADIVAIMHKSHNIFGFFEDLLDEVIILPQLDSLYREAADWNQQPDAVNLVSHGVPAYPEKLPVSVSQRIINFIFRILHRIFV